MHRQIACLGVIQKAPLGIQVLIGDFRRDRPILVHLHRGAGTAAEFIDRVIVLLGDRIVGLRVIDRVIGQAGGRVVDITAIVLVIANQPHGELFVHWNIDKALGHLAKIALAIFVDLYVIARLELADLGLVRDDAQRAGQRAGTKQRALRTRQRLDAFHVIDMHIGHTARRGHRYIVQINAHRGRLATGGGNPAKIGHAAPRPERRKADRRQHLHIVGKGGNLVLLQLFRAQRLKADRHLLDALGLVGGGHHDFAKVASGCRSIGIGGLRDGRHHQRGQKRCCPQHP